MTETRQEIPATHDEYDGDALVWKVEQGGAVWWIVANNALDAVRVWSSVDEWEPWRSFTVLVASAGEKLHVSGVGEPIPWYPASWLDPVTINGDMDGDSHRYVACCGAWARLHEECATDLLSVPDILCCSEY